MLPRSQKKSTRPPKRKRQHHSNAPQEQECVAHVIQTQMECGDSVLPFVSQFYNSTSTCIWEDGVTHEITQGEGGEQHDPRMPALFAMAQHRALFAMRVVAPRPDTDQGKTQVFKRGPSRTCQHRCVTIPSPHCDQEAIVWKSRANMNIPMKEEGVTCKHLLCVVMTNQLRKTGGCIWQQNKCFTTGTV